MTRPGIHKRYEVSLANNYKLDQLPDLLKQRGFYPITTGERPIQAWYKRINFGNDPNNRATLYVNALIPDELVAFGEYHRPRYDEATVFGNPSTNSVKSIDAHIMIDRELVNVLEGMLDFERELQTKNI